MNLSLKHFCLLTLHILNDIIKKSIIQFTLVVKPRPTGEVEFVGVRMSRTNSGAGATSIQRP